MIWVTAIGRLRGRGIVRSGRGGGLRVEAAVEAAVGCPPPHAIPPPQRQTHYTRVTNAAHLNPEGVQVLEDTQRREFGNVPARTERTESTWTPIPAEQCNGGALQNSRSVVWPGKATAPPAC